MIFDDLAFFTYLLYVEIAVTLIYTTYIVYKYASISVPFYVFLFTSVTWFFSFVVICILPYDIYINNNTSIILTATTLLTSTKQYIYILWQIIYWAMFCLTWFILPFIQSYEGCGELTIKNKIFYALKVNIIMYVIMAVIGLGLIIYIGVQTGFSNIFPLLAALSNTYGIFLIILCLGFGIVYIPRTIWRQRTNELKLKYYQFKAWQLDIKMSTIIYELEDLIKILQTVSTEYQVNLSKELNEMIKKTLNTIPDEINLLFSVGIKHGVNAEMIKSLGAIDESYILNLIRKINNFIMEYKRANFRMDQILKDAFLLQDIINSAHLNVIYSKLKPPRNGLLGKTLDKLEWYYYHKLQNCAYITLAIVFGIFSVSIFVGEMLILFFTAANFNFFFIALLFQKLDVWGIQIFCVVPLIYLSCCVYSAMFNVKLGSYYGLYLNKHTDSASLIFFAKNFSRVATPLCYNFMQMVGIERTTFFDVMGNMKIIPIISDLPTLLPGLLLLFVLMNYFEIHKKILNCIGIKRFQFSDSYTSTDIEKGKLFINERRKLFEEKAEKSFKDDQLADEENNFKDNELEKVKTSSDSENKKYKEF